MTPLTSPNPPPTPCSAALWGHISLCRGKRPRAGAHMCPDTPRHPVSSHPPQDHPRGPSRRLLEGGKGAVPPPPPEGDSQGAGSPPASSPNPRAAVPVPRTPRCCSHSSQLASHWWRFLLYLSVLFKLQSTSPPIPANFAYSLPLACGGAGCSTHGCWQGAHPAAPHPCLHHGGLTQHCRGGEGGFARQPLPRILCSPLAPRVVGAGPGPPTLTPRPGFGLWSRRSCLWRAA